MIDVMADQLDARVHVGADLREFGTWMSSEQRRIFLLCRRLLQDPDEADSATQDVFLKAYKALSKGDAKELDHPDKWVTRIAVNTCLDRLRSKAWKIWQRRPKPEDEQIILGMAASATPDAEAQLFAKQIQQRLELALQKLSDRQRAASVHIAALRCIGFGRDLAEILKLDVGTVKAHLFRALGKLRGRVEGPVCASAGY